MLESLSDLIMCPIDMDLYGFYTGMTKIKMSKEESGSSDFVERRRLTLER